MRFSIVTVTYNAEKYLRDTLESVASQTYRHFEHVLWDGGSKDQTLEIAKKFPHLRIESGKDLGISDAMNQASRLTSGGYLWFLHADDFFPHHDVLSEVAALINRYPSLEWICGQCHFVTAEKKIIRTTLYRPYQSGQLKKYNCLSHPSTILKKDLFKSSGGFDTHLKYCMDYDLWLRLSQRVEPLILPDVWASFRMHDHSLSTKETRGVADEAYQVRERYLKGWVERMRSYRTWKKRRKQCGNG